MIPSQNNRVAVRGNGKGRSGATSVNPSRPNRLLEAVTTAIPPNTAQSATNLIHQLNGDDRRFITEHRRGVLTWILDTAIQVARADKGNIQVFDPAAGGLRIVAQRGFPQPFLEYFDLVHDQQSACSAAMQVQQSVIVQDVTHSAVFADAMTLEVILDAGVRAVQSIPLVGSSGALVGMLSIHYRTAQSTGMEDSIKLGILADKAAKWVERMIRVTCERRFSVPPCRG